MNALSAKELNRLRALEDYEILDTLPEAAYDRIVSLASEICHVPIALFSLVDRDRQWFKAARGVGITETSREVSFCAHAIAADCMMVVEDTLADPRFSDNPLVRGEPRIRFYAGVPVRAREGEMLGTLCAIDRIPRRLSSMQIRMLSDLALEVEAQLELRRTIRALEDSIEERAVQTAMITHDAHNLITRMYGALERLDSGGEAAANGSQPEIEELRGSLGRLVRMCENFVSVNRADGRDLKILRRPIELRHWLSEVHVRERARARRLGIELELVPPEERLVLVTDRDVLDRVLGNLLENAFQACNGNGEVAIRATWSDEGDVQVAVEDNGPGVPVDLRDQIFEPYFSRRPDGSRGSGLGLAFCKVAAEKLGGDIVCETSSAGGARFALTLPRAS